MAPGRKPPPTSSGQESEYDAFPVSWILLHGTVGTLEPVTGGEPGTPQGWPAGTPGQEGGATGNLLSSVNELVEGISGDHVTTDELDGRVGIRGLLAEDGAGKHRVVPALHA